MSTQRTRSIVRGALALLVAAAAYEAIARSGIFPKALLPLLPLLRRCAVSSGCA